MAAPTLYFAVQTRLHRGADGAIRTDFGYARSDAWAPFLEAVDNVVIIARVTDKVSDSGELVEGDRVSVLELPFYSGPRDFIVKRRKISAFMRAQLQDRSAIYAARVPNIIVPLLQQRAKQLGAPFIAQIVGDAQDVLRSGIAGRVGRAVSSLARASIARQVANASGVIYVTRESLQAKYPAGPGVPTLVRSNVEIDIASFADGARDYAKRQPASPPVIVVAGSQEQTYKGHDILISAIALLEQRGIVVAADILGSGKYHDDLVAQAAELGVADKVTFSGHVPSAVQVRSHILAADIFAMPSRTEGLPRVLVEAMATGTVCIGSRVGGIPELLTDDALFDAEDPAALADSIESLISDPARMSRLAEIQFEEARLIGVEFSGTKILTDYLRIFTDKAGHRSDE